MIRGDSLFRNTANNLGRAAENVVDKLGGGAKTADTLRVATQNAAALQESNAEREANGQQPIPATNVWTQSWNRLGDHVTGDTLPMTTPIGAVQSIADQGWDAFNSTSLDGFSDAAGQQWDVISNDFEKLFSASPKDASLGEKALGKVGNIFSLFTSIEQMVTMWVGLIPFPAFPALRVLDTATAIPPRIGNIIPVPFVSGANTVLINGMPAGRCGDMGISTGLPWPIVVTGFEVFFGSCNVWIEGARAGRLMVDFTQHIAAGWGPCITGSANVMVGGVPLPSLVGIAMGAAFQKVFKGLGKVARRLKNSGKAVDNLADDVGKAADNVADDAVKTVDNVADDVGEAIENVADDVKKVADDAPTKACTGKCPIRFITGECFDQFVDFEIAASFPYKWTRHYRRRISSNQCSPREWFSARPATRIVFSRSAMGVP